MILINLLPHREIRRAARLRQFVVLTVLSAVLGATMVLAGYVVNNQRIEEQNGRNALLKTEIANLNKQIEEIKELKQQTAALLARKQVVETLQTNRTETVHMLDQFVRQLPDGVYLKSIRQSGKKVNLSGYAQSSARVSTLMRNLDGSQWLALPELVEIKAATVNSLRVNEFSLNVKIGQANQVTETQGPAASPSKAKGSKR